MKNNKTKLQSNKSKKAYIDSHPLIIDILNDGEIHYRKELMNKLGLNDSGVRAEIGIAKLYYPIVSFSSRAGYRLVRPEEVIESKDKETAKIAIKEINHTLRENASRIRKLKKNMKALIAAERIIMKSEIAKGLESYE